MIVTSVDYCDFLSIHDLPGVFDVVSYLNCDPIHHQRALVFECQNMSVSTWLSHVPFDYD